MGCNCDKTKSAERQKALRAQRDAMRNRQKGLRDVRLQQAIGPETGSNPTTPSP